MAEFRQGDRACSPDFDGRGVGSAAGWDVARPSGAMKDSSLPSSRHCG
jgi:hypothetical protein